MGATGTIATTGMIGTEDMIVRDTTGTTVTAIAGNRL
jgi:hypothetical protein